MISTENAYTALEQIKLWLQKNPDLDAAVAYGVLKVFVKQREAIEKNVEP